MKTKSTMNLSKLQSEAVKEYRIIFKGTVMWQEHESFLADQIQKAYQLGLKDAIDKYFLDAEKKLSTQSKEKMK